MFWVEGQKEENYNNLEGNLPDYEQVEWEKDGDDWYYKNGRVQNK